MAAVAPLRVEITVNTEPLRAALYDLLQVLGHAGVAEALYGAPGVLVIERSMADTRDGREQIIADVQSAFEDEKIGVILIKDGQSVSKTLKALGYVPGVPAQGYA